MFTTQELQAIAQLIGRAEIKGSEAMTVAVLLQKIDTAIKSKTPRTEGVAPAQATTVGKPAPIESKKK